MRESLLVSRRVGWLFVALLVACAPKEPEPLPGMSFVRVPAGTFVMGANQDERFRRDDEVPHRVTITREFSLSATEVTQAQWTSVMGSNPSHFKNAGPNAPVENVSWNEVHEFLRRLNERGEGRFRLPTEAEWEYACRAGTTTAYAFGDWLSTDAANYDGRYALPGQKPGRYRASTIAVASFLANAWGLYDMHGNVWEWCADEYCPYPKTAVTDPFNRCGSKYKVIRGGSWYFGADSARSALRYTHEPQLRGFSIGFRVVREATR